MNTDHSDSGAMSWTAVEFIWARWGGGARPGKTHVFPGGITVRECDRWGIPWSQQAVVDDFGNLVPVQ